MKILAFDTCMQSLSVAVLNEGQLFSEKIDLDRGHAEKLMPMIAKVLSQAETNIKDIDRIALTHGPGTFTGVRIGVATARGLALATGAELVATSTLHLLAAQAFASWPSLPGRLVCVAIDARRDQIYFGLFDENGPMEPGPRVLHPRHAGGLLPKDKDIFIIGSGSKILLDTVAHPASAALQRAQISPDTDCPQPDAAILAQLALSLRVLDRPLSPLYLRPADAKTQSGYAIERK